MSPLPPSFTHFAVALDGPVARIDFNRPERANALTLAMWHELGAAFRWADASTAVRVVVLAGRGRHFSAGIDLEFLAELRAGLGEAGPGRQQEALRETILGLQATVTAIEDCRKPVIAQIAGACIGGAVDIACACDLRYASADARFSVKELDLAIVADLGTLQRLPRLVGDGVARELIYTAREFGAEEAARIGFVSAVLPDAAALAARVAEVAAAIAAKSPLAVRGVKHALAYSREHGVADGLAQVAALNASLLLAPDVAEAVAAHVARRPARFDD
ncbi:MAG: crotonase/enoyl-CoA hydratase family protein [Gammaproteobacteria bacterium]